MNSHKLRELREDIDRLDFELLKLLRTRMETALKIRKFKSADEIVDASREQQVIERVVRQTQSLGLLSPEFAEDLFNKIMEESRAIQAKGHQLIGFQGEHGAYSEVAARAYHPGLAYIPCPEFADVFESVSKGYLDLGVVPVENTLGGAITQVNELLIDTELHIIGEIKLPIHHCLLALPGTDHREIRMAYSHPQGLTQCRDFLLRNHLEPRPFYDTAGSARMLSVDRPKASAAIASALCADIYNLEVIKERIEDHAENKTRFLIISREKPQEPGTKCSIIFSVAHHAGALFEIVRVFAESNINLTRIESMPNRDNPGNYYFFLDFDGVLHEEKIQHALEVVQQHTMMYKFLGWYKEVAPQ